MSEHYIQEGHWAVIVYENEKTYLYRVSKQSFIRLGQFKCCLEALIGKRYGTRFEPVLDADAPPLTDNVKSDKREKKRKRKGTNVVVKPGKLLVVTEDVAVKDYLEERKQDLLKELEQVETQIKGGNQHKADNSRLEDKQFNQKLTPEDIQRLKGTGASTEKIVGALLQNSSTFEEKTDFSQEKYVRKKSSVHSLRIRVLKCNSQTIGQILWDRGSFPGSHLGGVRYYDALPQILTYANVHSGARVLVWDNFNGYVLGSVMERLAGQGQVISGFIGPTFPENSFLQYFNFPKEISNTLLRCDLTHFLVGATGDKQIETIETARKRRLGYLASATTTKEKELKQARFDAWYAKKKEDLVVYESQKKTFSELRTDGADSLVIVSKTEPKQILLKLFPYLAIGRSFCVFCEYIEPLSQSRDYLERNHMAVGVRVVETWFRKYQVLPNRTHPNVKMNGASGYLLFGTKVATENF